MKATNIALVLVVLAGCSSITRIQPSIRTYEFDCDVPAGNFSEWTGTDIFNETQITGQIELVEPRLHERWLPAASVSLSGEGREERIGLQVLVTPGTPNELQVGLLKYEDSQGHNLFAAQPWKNNPIAFILTLYKSGEVTVAASGKTTSLGIAQFNIKKLSLICSSAQFKFTHVSVMHK